MHARWMMVTAVLFAGSLPAMGKEPPLPHTPIGLLPDGSYADVLELSNTKRWQTVALRLPACSAYQSWDARFPTFDISFHEDAKRPALRFGASASPNGNALLSKRGYRYRLSSEEVFPFFAELYYVVVFARAGIQLRRVTPRVDAEYRPQIGCRTIPTNAESTFPLFWNKVADDEGGVKILRIDAAEGESRRPRATVRIYPPVAQMPPSKTIVSRPPPFEVTVQPGDTLATVYQGYKVLKVVPPAKVAIQPGRGEKAATTGRLVGWIELDPNPLPPPAKQ